MCLSIHGGCFVVFFFQAEDGIRDGRVTGIQTCALPILTTPYVFNAADAKAMAAAGADIIVCHLGLTTGGAIGAQTALKLEDCPVLIDAWAAAALDINSEILVLAHGGPVAEPADAGFIMKQARKCHGFYGASSMERLPVERALTEQVRKFKAIGGR